MYKKKHMKREENGLKRKNLNKDVKNLKPQKNQHKKLTLILKSFFVLLSKTSLYDCVFPRRLKKNDFFVFA